MGLFDGLMKNKALQSVFLKQFKDIAKEHNLKYIVLKIDDNGNFDTELHKGDIKVLPIEEYNALIEAVKSNL